MTGNRTTSARRSIVARPGDSVKARIIGAGLRCGDVATKAGLSNTTLSDYFAGRIRNIHGQISILMAFCSLSGQSLTVRQFWGALTAPEAA